MEKAEEAEEAWEQYFCTRTCSEARTQQMSPVQAVVGRDSVPPDEGVKSEVACKKLKCRPTRATTPTLRHRDNVTEDDSP